MARYLLVLYDVEDSHNLVATACSLSAVDPAAEFVLITPAAAPAFDQFIEPRCSATRIAARRARRTQDQLVDAGVNLIASRMGNFDPFRALEDALRFSEYAAVVIAAPEYKLLHFMHCDLPCRLARKFPQTRVLYASNNGHHPSITMSLQPVAVTRSAHD